MNNAPVAPKAKKPKQYELKAKDVQPKPAKQPKKAKEAHECEKCEPYQTEANANQNIENKKTNTQVDVEKLPFGIKKSQINKYIVYGEILATPACRKQRSRY